MTAYQRTDRVLLQIKDVNLAYGDNIVLRDVNATITDVIKPGQTIGQVVAFLGPSGIGKSQLSRTIAGLQQPDSGGVYLSHPDKSMSKVGPGLVGMVPQNYPLFDYLTVRQNLEVAGRQARLKSVECNEKIQALAMDLGLVAHLKKYPCELSGGTKQRVAIAQQFMCVDHVLVMDEPFSGLDPIAKASVGKLIVDLSDRHEDNIIIFVTHDIRSIQYADMVWVMGLEQGCGHAIDSGPTVRHITECNRQVFLPGARIVESYDMAAMGLCWEPDIDRKPDFVELVHHIEDRFKTLR